MDSQKLLSWRDPNYTAKFNHYILEEGIHPNTLESEHPKLSWKEKTGLKRKIPNSSEVPRLKDTNLVPPVGKAQDANLQFNSEQKLVNHFDKHSAEVAHALKRTDYSIEQYLKDANFVVETGTYVPELNAYVKFIGYEGKNTLYAFVGLDQNTGNITTYHVKTVDYLIKKAPSLGFER